MLPVSLETWLWFRGIRITVIGDGTEQQISTALDKFIEQFTYSEKKAKHTFTLLIACSPDGDVYLVSLSYPGSKNDINVYDMEENLIHRHIIKAEWVMFDKGYSGVFKHCSRVAIPVMGKTAASTRKRWHTITINFSVALSILQLGATIEKNSPKTIKINYSSGTTEENISSSP